MDERFPRIPRTLKSFNFHSKSNIQSLCPWGQCDDLVTRKVQFSSSRKLIKLRVRNLSKAKVEQIEKCDISLDDVILVKWTKIKCYFNLIGKCRWILRSIFFRLFELRINQSYNKGNYFIWSRISSKIIEFNDFDFNLIIRTYMYTTFNNTQLRKKMYTLIHFSYDCFRMKTNIQVRKVLLIY